ncbi:MAG: hypothetical protein JSU66_02190 [Deltaproteobacteria bacterium]|nr:MAG: hypothetical protein JSU66_02190 [Deltaproteobacteria bacterium]
MPEPPAHSRLPAFNHVAMGVPSELLGERERGEILDFYGEVFGWTEMPTMTKDGQLLVLRCYSNEQFVFLHATRTPMRCDEMDHFGMSVGTEQELDAMLARARTYRERDARVEIIDKKTDDFRVLKLHNFYVRYLLPLMVEVQCYEWAAGFGEQSQPTA